MATHSRVLAWRILGTVEPGGLPSMGSHRVGHDWSGLAAAAATVQSTVVQGLYFKPRMSRSKCRNSGDVARSAKKGQLLFWTTVHFKVLFCKIRNLFFYILCLFFMYYLYEKYYIVLYNWFGFPGGSAVKNPPAVQEPQETWVRSLGWEDPLEEGMTTHSSILAWRIPWTEGPGRL